MSDSKNKFFNAHHSPIGAFASFTLGFKGAKGGLGLELGRPADQDVYIGLEAREGGRFEALPFYNPGHQGEFSAYDLEGNSHRENKLEIAPFADAAITRDFQLGTDSWRAGDLTFTIYSPAEGVPDPATGTPETLKPVLVPAVLARLTIDNRQGKTARRAYFGYKGNDPYAAMRQLYRDGGSDFAGVGQGRNTAIMTRSSLARPAMGFCLEDILRPLAEENWTIGLGSIAVLVVDVPAFTQQSFDFAVVFHREGLVTTGLDTRYFYSHWFPTLESAGEYALQNFTSLAARCTKANELVSQSRLSADQKFQLTHSIRSYYGSTEFLEHEGQPLWVVNEGQYRMINTFDLTVDQLFFELKFNPWTVKNELDLFTKRYSYTDEVHFPGDPKAYPGGLSFTHDMGVRNAFTRAGYSSYEMYGISGCFSQMTHEQLTNWVSCATVYAQATGDSAWLKQNLSTLEACLHSLVNRDHPNPAQRNGVMKLDSSRTKGGAEITTYDSLDVSLGQARNNVYLAVKDWAAYVALEKIFSGHGKAELAQLAGHQAELCAATIVSMVDAQGLIPAVFEHGNASRIIPAIEGLVFPYFAGCPEALFPQGRFGALIRALKTHLEKVLVPGVCLFDDGGWKLSSSSNNSWLSKIYLCQFVARKILGLPWDATGARADHAHVTWLLHPELSYQCWSDQIISGVAKGSLYYPRGVTSILWLNE